MSEAYLVRYESARPALRRLLWPTYGVAAVGLVVGVGVVGIAALEPRTSIGGLLLVVIGLVLIRPRLRELVTVLRARRAPLTSRLALALDDEGVTVFHGAEASGATARLSWTDCAAVVASPWRVGVGDRTGTYVQFVPTHDDRVVAAGVPEGVAAAVHRLTGVPATSAALVVLVGPAGTEATTAAVLREAARRSPHTRVVDSLPGSRTG